MEGDNLISEDSVDTAHQNDVIEEDSHTATDIPDPETTNTIEGDTECTCERNPCTCQPSQSSSSATLESEGPSVFRKKISTVGLRLDNGKKPKLRTSKDVYDRLKWDSASVFIKTCNEDGETNEVLDTSSVYIGYKDRFLGICELPFYEFIPGGEIPFHRLYYFRTGGPPVAPFIGEDGEVKVREDNLPEGAVFIWDRESRTDLVFNSGNSTCFKKSSTRSK